MSSPHTRPCAPHDQPTEARARRHRLLSLGLAWALSCTALPSLAQNAPYADVDRLVRAGQLEQALQKADNHLASQQRDPQMRFLKGVILAQQGRSKEAMDLYTQLTRDNPELPEPFNNLAVLQAAQNQLDEARASLEMAIRLNPGYATAQQNLGDVYANLAGRAWTRSLQLEPTNPDLYKRVQQWRTLTPTASATK